ncbi:TPA: hypothetical protein QCW42_004065 [Bacillus cereus]|nr:hypothetical protein [Bacillus cereus]
MTLNDFIKRITTEDLDKMIVFRDEDGSWSNINIEVKKHEISITCDTNELFSSDK